jgi:hypothetical protein
MFNFIFENSIAYKTKQNPVLKKNLSVEATNTTGLLLYLNTLRSTDGVYRKVFPLNPRDIFEIMRFL